MLFRGIRVVFQNRLILYPDLATSCGQILRWENCSKYVYVSKHVVDESSFRCDAKTTECTMDIHVRRMANISDMNVQATGIALNAAFG